MYVVAQRVRSPSRTGINVLLYRHMPGPIPWQDPARVAEMMPGRLASHDIEIPPGGNEVLSFIDIVASEEVPTPQLIDTVSRLRDEAVQRGIAVADGVGVRFSATGVANREREGRELAHRALELLKRPLPLWQPGVGLVIRQEVDGDGLLFTLAPESLQKLRETLGHAWRAPIVSVPYETMGDLRGAGFDAHEQVITAMTGYGLTGLLRFGRVRVEDHAGQTVWEWPAGELGVGYCLTCHRQHTLTPAGSGFRCTNCGTEQREDGRFVAALT